MGVAPFFMVFLSDDDESRVTVDIVDLTFLQVTNRRWELYLDKWVLSPSAFHDGLRFLLGDFESGFAIEPPYNVLCPDILFANRQGDDIALGARSGFFVFVQSVDVALCVDFGVGDEMPFRDGFVGEAAQGLVAEGGILAPAVDSVFVSTGKIIRLYAVGAYPRVFGCRDRCVKREGVGEERDIFAVGQDWCIDA